MGPLKRTRPSKNLTKKIEKEKNPPKKKNVNFPLFNMIGTRFFVKREVDFIVACTTLINLI